MGMDSKKLSARKVQPGHDQTYRESENNFIVAARRIFDSSRYVDSSGYTVQEKPDDLREIFASADNDGRSLGITPEASITSIKTKRKVFFEVKKQGDQGNAEERAYKHHTVQFYKTLKSKYNYSYHPYITIFCEALATNERYTKKFPFLLEKDQYFLWKNYDEGALETFLKYICSSWLDGA